MTMGRVVLALAMMSMSGAPARSASTSPIASDQPRPLPGVRPDAATIAAWTNRKFGMFIHFGLYSVAGGVWNGKNVDNGYSEQIMANAPIAKADYEKLAAQFDPVRFDPDAIVALAKAAGMRFIVVTAKHHDGFSLFATAASPYNAVDGTPYHRDIVKMLADACRRGGIAFGVYYSTIDWHQPNGNAYLEGNSNPITPAQEAFNLSQIRELTHHYGALSEIWFDMGRPTPDQSKHFTDAVHDAQRSTMVSGRVWNHEGDFTVMGDNAIPAAAIEEPWQTAASVYDETWGYRSWQVRDNLDAKVRQHIEQLVHVVSAGGNYILNIGPRGDGSVVPFETRLLERMGMWMKTNGAAIYGASRSPFDKLDFGYATLQPDRLYLIVTSMPPAGHLYLPGVVGDPFGTASVLGSPTTTLAIRRDERGVWIDASALAGAQDGNAIPVICIDLRRPLAVRPATIPLNAADATVLARSDAVVFQNYNGFGYDAPALTYKMRWTVDAPAGRYRMTMHFAAPVSTATPITVETDRMPIALTLPAGARSVSTTVTRDRRAMPGAMQFEVTPAQPFTKAAALPVDIEKVIMDPIRPE